MQLKTNKSQPDDDRFAGYGDEWWGYQFGRAGNSSRVGNKHKKETNEHGSHSADYEARAEQAVNRW